MSIEEFKRWHWAIIGLIAGLALSYAWTSMDPPTARRSTKALGFEQELAKPPLKSGEPNVSHIIVYPPIKDGRQKDAYLVEFDLRTPTKDGKAWTYQPWSFVAETPFAPTTNRPPTTMPNETVLTFLSRVSAKDKNVKFTYAWWRTPKWTYTLFTAASVLVIGGVWPTLLNLLVGAGFGRPKTAEAEYDLNRFKGEDEARPAKPTGPSEEDLRKLAAAQASIENALGLAAEPKPRPNLIEPTPQPKPAIRRLDGAPVEAKTEEKSPQQEKDYRGEYYPTAKGKKKD